MAFTVEQTVRYRTRQVLAASSLPLTATAIAAHLDTTPRQAARALRQLEAAGHATRTPGQHHQGGRDPDTWTTR